MKKSGTLITSALLAFGIAAGALAADMPKTAAPMAADTPASGTTTTPSTSTKHKKHSSSSKSGSSSKKKATTPAPTTAK